MLFCCVFDKMTLMIIAVLALVAVILSIVVVAKKPNSSEFFKAFPWGPIDPKRNDFPLVTQAVMGYPSSYFGLCSGPNNCGQGATYGGAATPLKLLQDRVNYYNYVRPNWRVNQGYKNDGNTFLNLQLGEKPTNAYTYL